MVGVSGEGRRGRVQAEGQRERVGKGGEGPPRTGRGGEGGVGQISSYCTKSRKPTVRAAWFYKLTTTLLVNVS